MSVIVKSKRTIYFLNVYFINAIYYNKKKNVAETEKFER